MLPVVGPVGPVGVVGPVGPVGVVGPVGPVGVVGPVGPVGVVGPVGAVGPVAPIAIIAGPVGLRSELLCFPMRERRFDNPATTASRSELAQSLH